MGRFWCDTCGNIKCTCAREVGPTAPQTAAPAPLEEDRQRVFLETNEETGVAELIFETQAEQNRKFNELIASTPHAWVTIGLIALNIAIFIGMIIGGVLAFQPTPGSLLPWGANFGPLTTHGQWWRVITAIFVHAGILHLLFNMFCLFRVGFFAERVFGNARFTGIYLLSGIGGNLASLCSHPLLVCVGASGAIFGVYGAILGLLMSRPNAMPVSKAQSLTKDAVVFVGVNLIFGMTTPEVDVTAHVGGLVTGLLQGAALARPLLLPDGTLRPRNRLASTAVVAASLVLLAGVARLAPVTDDFQAEIKRLGSVEHVAVTLFNDSLAKLRRKDVTPSQFAEIIENQLLPPWNAQRDRILKLRIPQNETILLDKMEKIGKYMSLRREAWGLTANGIRSDDPTMVKAANKKQSEAVQVMRSMRFNGPVATIPGKGITPCPNDPDYVSGQPWDPMNCFDNLTRPR